MPRGIGAVQLPSLMDCLLLFRRSISLGIYVCIASLSESAGIFGTLLGGVLVGRAAFVFPLSALANYLRKPSTAKITWREQVVQGTRLEFL